MLSLQVSEMELMFLKTVFYWESFDVGLIRVGARRKGVNLHKVTI